MKNIVALLFLHYLRIAAQLQLLKNKPIIIGITGSAGKTSTKQAIAAALSSLSNLKVCGYVNSESGIPLDILGISIKTYSYYEWLKIALIVPLKLLFNWEKYTYYLVEMGIDSPNEPKNMGYLLKIVNPSIGILLNAFPMHSQAFDHLLTTSDPKKRQQEMTKLIANEKGKLLTHLPPSGLAVFNSDQKEFETITNNVKAKKLSVGFNKKGGIICSKIEYNNDSTILFYLLKNKKITITIHNYFLPEHFLYTIGVALAVGKYVTKNVSQTIANIEKYFTLPPGRSSLFKGIHGSLILDSSYNASRKPMIDSLNLLKKIPSHRNIAILGDMRELGNESQLEHELVAKHAASILDLAILVGPEMKKYALPILTKANIPTQWFPSAQAAAEYLKPKLKKNDLVLVKGSQNTLLLEIAVEELLANKSDSTKLCRRGGYWDKRRKELLAE